MKDARLTTFSRALEDLIESLEATVRVKGWSGAESVPEPLKESAARLLARLGTADRLSSTGFKGTPVDVTRVTTMLGAIRRLDAAYVTYRRQLETPSGRDGAAAALGAEVEDLKTKLHRGGLIRAMEIGAQRPA